jgi:hypothetical protein
VKRALVAILGAALIVPASASATVTIGSNLGRVPPSPTNQNTSVNTSLDPSAQASGGLASPVNGVVTSWRVRTGDTGGDIALRVIRPLAGFRFLGAGTSGVQSPPLNTTSPAFPAQLPISIGDLIGLNCAASGCDHLVSGGGVLQSFSFVLADGDARDPTFDNFPFELAVQAEIEPTATLSDVKAKPKKRGKVRVSLEAPNPGTFKAQAKTLKAKTVPVAAPGPLTVVLKAKKAARADLADGERVKAKLKLSFTPTGGSAATQAVKVRLKP